jgi:enamine deaminase RidA (YjgF/YER057c/UK114 family)
VSGAAQEPVFWFDHTRPLFEPLGCVDARRRGKWVWVSAQAGIDDQLVALDGLATQSARAFHQLRTAFEAAGGDSAAVCQLTVYVQTALFEGSLAEASSVVFAQWRSIFPDGGTTATLIGSQMFGIPKLFLEVHCMGRALKEHLPA